MAGAVYTDFGQLATLRGEAQQNPNAALEDVAAQFESLFLQQMLKSMRDATMKSDLFDSSQMETYQQMADQQVALQLSEQGGIGLARALVEQMQVRGYVGEPAASPEAAKRDAFDLTPTAETAPGVMLRDDAAKAFSVDAANPTKQKWEG